MSPKLPILMGRAAIAAALVLLVAGCEPSLPEKKHAFETARQDRLKWEQKNLVDAYQQSPTTNPKWDDSAKAALAELARLISQTADKNEDPATIISNECTVAMQAGCDDPLVRYAAIRFCPDPSQTKEQYADAFCQVALALQNSSYPAIRKYYGWFRASQEVSSVYGYGTNVPAKFRAMQIWGLMESDLMTGLADKTMPPREIYEACSEYLNAWRGNKDRYSAIYQQILGIVTDKRAESAPMLLLKGEAYTQLAWQARGGGYANTVTADGWKQFGEKIGTAEAALTKAWNLSPFDPEIAVKMITVELAQGKGRDRMELWFKRAMDLDPNNYDACDAKLLYIEPKWYGSTDDMLAFGRECVQNERWGGHVPLILLDAHRAIQSQFSPPAEQQKYWARPEVWKDIKDAFDRFFDLNPDATGWYHDYAWYAFQAGEWAKFNELVPKLGHINYSFFGGTEQFEQMVAEAKEKAGHN